MILGESTAMRALKSVDGMDKVGPAYLMARESAAERENTLRMGLMLVFMKGVVGRSVGDEMPFHFIIGSATEQFSSIKSNS